MTNRAITEKEYMKSVSSVFARINVLFLKGRLLVYDEASPSIENMVGGSTSVVIDMPVSTPVVTTNPDSNDEKDTASTATCRAGKRKRTAYEGDLEAIAKSLRIIPDHGLRGWIIVSLTGSLFAPTILPVPILRMVVVTHLKQ
jgi:hypothetical protein